MIYAVKDQDGQVYDVFVCDDHIELDGDRPTALRVEPEDLLHELTKEGTLRVKQWQRDGKYGAAFGISLPQEALAHLRSLARNHALLPAATLDTSRVRPSSLAS